MTSSEVSQFIRKSRIEKNFKSMRELWKAIADTQAKAGNAWITYQYFQQIESTGRIPPIDIYLDIVNFLGIDEKQAVYLYAQSMMPTARTKAYFDLDAQKQTKEEAKNLPQPTTTKWEPDQVYDVPDDHFRFFAENPLAYEVLCALIDTTARTVDELVRVLRATKAEVKKALQDLEGLNLINKKGNGFQFVRSTMKITGTQSNRDLQWKIFSKHLQSVHSRFYDLTTKNPTFRTSFIAPLKPDDARSLLTDLRALLKKMEAFEVEPSPKAQAFYMGIVFGPRFYEE